VSVDPSYAEQARQQAHQILSRAPYAGGKTSSPHPLAGFLHAIGRGLDIVFGPVGRWIDRQIFRPVGSGFTSLFGSWSPFAGLVIAVAAGVILALLLVRRRSRISARSGPPLPSVTIASPSDLDEEADRFATAGEFGRAFRLRFEAGLLRLEIAGLIVGQNTSTDAEISARIGSPTFDRLATRHEAFAYAGESAGAADVRQARTDWPLVPDEARSHPAASRGGAR
jgi:hypothetical protein